MEIKRGQVWRNKKSGNLVQVVPEPCVLVFTSPKGKLVAEHSLVVFEQLYEPVATEDAQMIKSKYPSPIKNKDLTLPDNCIENKTQSKAEPLFDAMKRFSEMLPKIEGEERVMEIKVGQIWKRINMDEFFKVVHVSGSDIYLNHLGVRNVSLVTEAVLKDFYTLVCNKGEFIKDKSNMQKTHSTDMVNKPPHYKDASGIECKEITCHRKMPFSLGNAIKYLYRAGSKGDLLEDLKKAEWYLRVAYLNSEAVPEEIVRRLREVAAVRKTEAGRALNLISHHKIVAAYGVVKSEVEQLEAGSE